MDGQLRLLEEYTQERTHMEAMKAYLRTAMDEVT